MPQHRGAVLPLRFLGEGNLPVSLRGCKKEKKKKTILLPAVTVPPQCAFLLTCYYWLLHWLLQTSLVPGKTQTSTMSK